MTGEVLVRTRVLLADNHAILTDGLVYGLAKEFDIVGTARDGRAALAMCREKRPDVIAMDVWLPKLNGIDTMRILRKEPGST
jgi:DNA-binding NarL/FixJ family response regulator